MYDWKNKIDKDVKKFGKYSVTAKSGLGIMMLGVGIPGVFHFAANPKNLEDVIIGILGAGFSSAGGYLLKNAYDNYRYLKKKYR